MQADMGNFLEHMIHPMKMWNPNYKRSNFQGDEAQLLQDALLKHFYLAKQSITMFSLPFLP